jgi:hypothetical protein
VSFRRFTIAAVDPPQRPAEPVDVLIDIARDALLAVVSQGSGDALLDAWAMSEVPLLRRSATYVWAVRSDLDGSAKLAWLLSAERLSDQDLRAEVLDLVEGALPSATLEVAESIVARIVSLGDALDGQSRFFLLGWVAKRFPESESAVSAFREAETKYPELVPGKRQTAQERFTLRPVEQLLPMSTLELHQRLDEDPSEVAADLLRYQGVEFPADGPSWSDVRQLITQTAREWPDDGFALVDVEPNAFLSPVVAGWAMAVIDDMTTLKILDRVETCGVEMVADELSRLLADGGRSELSPTRWDRLPQARTLAHRLWETLPSGRWAGEVGEDTDRWFERASNCVHGRLAEFWIHAIAGDWKVLGKQWTGLPDPVKLELEYMLESDDNRGTMAEVVFASRLRFFSIADWNWCKAELLPLFDWSDPVRARRIWESHLLVGTWTDDLLDAGLLDGYLAAVTNLAESSAELSSQLADHLASIAVSSKIRPLPWLRKFTGWANPGLRREWIERVTGFLDTMQPSVIEQHWQLWMKQYWYDRLSDTPRPLTAEESSTIAGWAIYLTSSVDAAVSFATSTPAGLEEHDDFLGQLAGDRIERAPRAFGRLIAHLLTSTQLPCWSLYQLPDIVDSLKQSADPEDLSVIRREAIRLRIQLPD